MAIAHSSIETVSSSPHSSKARLSGKKASLTELACLIFCIEVIMWISPLTASPKTTSSGMVLLIIVLLIVPIVRDRETASELGFRVDNFFPALARLTLPLSVFILVVVVIGLLAGTLRFGPKFFSMLVFVPLWALLQQYMLLGYVNRRMRMIMGEGKGSRIGTAAIFSILHLPNPVLMVACAVGGYIWIKGHEREANLFASALTHTLASAFVANALPGWLLKNMVVGYNYFLR